MTLELTTSEVLQVKELFYSKMDQVGGFNELPEELKQVFGKICLEEFKYDCREMQG